MTYRIGLLILAILGLISPVENWASEIDFRQFAAFADSLELQPPDDNRQAEVANLRLVRGGVEIVLEQGILTLGSPVAGRVFSASFSGKGRFKLTPPNRAEQYMLARHTQDSTADWTFSEIALLFTDSTENELGTNLSFSALGRLKAGSRPVKSFIDYIEDKMKMSYPALVMMDLFQPQRGGSFMARLATPRGDMVFMYDPKEIEEIQLYKHAHTGDGAFPDLVQSFHTPDQYAGSFWGPDKENKDLIDSLDYDISCKIFESAKTELDVAVSFQSKIDGLQALFFQLMPEIDQNSLRVIDPSGDSLFYLRLKDEYGVTVLLDKPLNAGEWTSLRFLYHSNEMVRKTPWGAAVLVYATTWYPRYGYLKRAKHKLEFSVPKQYEFVSVGKRVSEEIAGDFKISRWDVSKFPVAFVSYNYGPFNVDTGRILNDTPVAVYSGKSHRPSTAPIQHGVLLDVVASGSLFAAEVHSYPFDQLIATEIPSSHGQGLPGLLHLGYATFDLGLGKGFDDAFRAHEVAHQWWGHLVGWKTYHDQWLSEAFAEYFSGWYVQRKYQNDELNRRKFFELLDIWREDVFESGSYTDKGYQTAYQEGNDAGPIWMGFRLASSKSSDYSTLVYSKGAYVLYMLRMMMFDFAKKDDVKFREMLHDFLTEHRWSEATTADFQRSAEAAYGQPLDWFFDQWVYDTQLPEYRWEPTVRQQADGKYAVDVSVKVLGVKKGFRMPVPFTILMDGDYHTTMRLEVDELESTLTVSNLPYKPQSFVFNSFKSVLCKERRQ